MAIEEVTVPVRLGSLTAAPVKSVDDDTLIASRPKTDVVINHNLATYLIRRTPLAGMATG
ncbi:hypothetical protein [Bradyrhizobium sp.]|uniref:hypothetical protein n=1 Tax=Bradyrhizobium sp. TaxID=376 RepID=UPI003C783D8B